MRIEQYEELLNVYYKNFWNDDMQVYELQNYFNRVLGSIKKLNKFCVLYNFN